MSFDINESLKITELISLFELITKGGYNCAGENCDFWECVFLKKGELCLTLNERVYHLQEGDIIFHQPSSFHKYHTEHNQKAELFIFTINFEGTYADFFKDSVFTLNEYQTKTITSLIEFLHEKMSLFTSEEERKDELLKFCENKLHFPILKNYITLLLLSIYDAPNITTETLSESAKIFKQAVNFMTNNLDSNITIRTLAEKCCTNTTALKKIFAEYADCSIHKYFLTLKINKAVSLMADNLPIHKISDALGFSSQAYFCSAFKRETGLTPSDYKNKM